MMQHRFHVTVLSNFSRGFDKYCDSYSKRAIPESTYPDRFYVLRRDQLDIGVCKANPLLQKLGLANNELLVIETLIDDGDLHSNDRNGLGEVVLRPELRVHRLFLAKQDGDSIALEETTAEDAMARSLAVINRDMAPFEQLRPRTLSILPIARGCQAKCSFCFSEASVSSVQKHAQLTPAQVRPYARTARERGAERFVITGGGEPGLVPHDRLVEWIRFGNDELGKTVLITNAHHLGVLSVSERLCRLKDYAQAGLNILSISRHHSDDRRNQQIMSLAIDTGAIANSVARHQSQLAQLKLRLICVLQKQGVATETDLANYLDYAAEHGIDEVCFKELYVSTSTESVFHDFPSNAFSRSNRVPLSLVVNFADHHGFEETSRLPWGSPIYSGRWSGNPIKIAAYTEPSLYWERCSGVARSWNVLADGRCFVSLEDNTSVLPEEQVPYGI